MHFLKINVQRPTLRATRLFIVPYAGHVEIFRNGRIQNLLRGGCVHRLNLQLYSAEQIRNQPIQPHHIVIHQGALDPRGLQASFREHRFGQVPELADRHHPSELDFAVRRCIDLRRFWRRVAGHSRWRRSRRTDFHQVNDEASSCQLRTQRFSCDISEFIGLHRDSFQLPVHLVRVELGESSSLLLRINHCHGRESYSTVVRKDPSSGHFADS